MLLLSYLLLNSRVTAFTRIKASRSKIGEYLNSQKQSLVINGIWSPYVKVTSGVQHGSVLGPLLFLIYINDTVENVFSSIRLYADDCVFVQ